MREKRRGDFVTARKLLMSMTFARRAPFRARQPASLVDWI